MAYTRVNWENLPSTNTPINRTNLNKMENGIAETDNKVTALNTIVEGTYIAGSSSDVTIETGATNTFIEKIGNIVTMQIRFIPLVESNSITILTIGNNFLPKASRIVARAFAVWNPNDANYNAICELNKSTGKLTLNNNYGTVTGKTMFVQMVYMTDQN